MNLSLNELGIIKRIILWNLICNLFKRDNEIVYNKQHMWNLCLMCSTIQIHAGIFHKDNELCEEYEYRKKTMEEYMKLLVKHKPNLLKKMPEVIKNKILLSLAFEH